MTAALDLGSVAPSPLDQIDNQTIERALSAALEFGGDYADIYFEHRLGSDITLDHQKVKSAGEGITLGVGVRVLKGESTGYAYSESLDRLVTIARTAGQIASGGGGVEPAPLRRVDATRHYPIVEQAPPSVAHRVEILRRADAAARSFDSRVVRFDATLSCDVREILLATSDGCLARDCQPLIRISCRAVVNDEGRRHSGTSGGGGRFDFSFFAAPGHTPEDYGAEAARAAVVMLDARAAPAGELPLVLAAADSGILLHEAIGHGLEGDFNRRGTSLYSGRVGEQVASPLCTLVDDATVPSSRGSINVDDEGSPGKRTVLIEDGVLRGYLHDRISSQYFDVPRTGSGRRQSFRHAPMPRMTNTCVLAGEHDPREMIESIEKGIWAKRLSSGQVEISNGDFVFALAEAYLIENGKVTAPLKGVNIIGSGPEILNRVSMVGSDYAFSDGNWTCGKGGQHVPVSMGTPSLKVDRITIGGTQT